MAKDYYELLGVSRTAQFEEIKRSFRNKAKECHPDYHPGDAAAEIRFKEINEAYEVLKDDQKRAAYDQYGHEAYTNGMGRGSGSGFGGFDFSGTGFENIFEEIFSGFSGAARRGSTAGGSGQIRGSDARYDLSISLQEAYEGVKKSIEIETYVSCADCHGKGGKSLEPCSTCAGYGRVQQRQGFFVVETECPTCHGSGKTVKDPCAKCKGNGRIKKKRTLEVNVPKGVDSGIRMRLPGEGDAGIHGGASGDLYVFLTVKKHILFEREGANLYCEVPVPMTTAALGGTVIVPTMNGTQEKVEVKVGMQTGHQTKMKGKGMPVLKGDSFGDMFVTFRVETPINLNTKQKDLLKAFAAESGEDNQAACSDFLCQIKKIWNNL